MGPPSHVQITRVATDDQALQTQQRIFGELGLTSFTECLAPALDAILWRAFTFNGVCPGSAAGVSPLRAGLLYMARAIALFSVVTWLFLVESGGSVKGSLANGEWAGGRGL